MNNLINVQIKNKDGINVVSSRVIAKELGKEHSKVKRTIKTLLEQTPNVASDIFISEYNDRGRMLEEYLLTKDGFTLYMFNIQGYSDFKIAYINEFNRMEKVIQEQNSPKLPQDYLSALKALVESEEEKQRLSLEKAKIEEEKNRLIHQGKLYTTTEIAKELGFKSAKAFNEFLKEKKMQYKVNNTWVLAARFAELGYTEIKQTELDNGKIIYNRKWTGTGRDWLINEVMKGEC